MKLVRVVRAGHKVTIILTGCEARRGGPVRFAHRLLARNMSRLLAPLTYPTTFLAKHRESNNVRANPGRNGPRRSIRLARLRHLNHGFAPAQQNDVHKS